MRRSSLIWLDPYLHLPPGYLLPWHSYNEFNKSDRLKMALQEHKRVCLLMRHYLVTREDVMGVCGVFLHVRCLMLVSSCLQLSG